MNGTYLIAGINSSSKEEAPQSKSRLISFAAQDLISKNTAAKNKGTFPELQILRAAPITILVAVHPSLLKALVMGIPSSKASVLPILSGVSLPVTPYAFKASSM